MMRGWTGGFLLLFGTGPLSNKEGVAIDDSRLQVKAEWEAYALLPTHRGRRSGTVRLLFGERERRTCP